MGINYDPTPQEEYESQVFFSTELTEMVGSKVKNISRDGRLEEALTIAKNFDDDVNLNWTFIIVTNSYKAGRVITIEQLEQMEEDGILDLRRPNDLFRELGQAEQTNPAILRNLVAMGAKLDEDSLAEVIKARRCFGQNFVQPEFVSAMIDFGATQKDGDKDDENYKQRLANVISQTQPAVQKESEVKQLDNAAKDDEEFNPFDGVDLTEHLPAVDSSLQWGSGALIKAIDRYADEKSQSNLEILNILIGAGYDVNLRREGCSAVSHAIGRNEPACLDVLMNAGGRMDELEKQAVKFFDEKGMHEEVVRIASKFMLEENIRASKPSKAINKI